MIQPINNQYGQPIWPVTHIDAVIDGEGRTLRQLLGDIPSAASIQAEIDKIIKDAPEALDTLKEIDDYITVNGYNNLSEAINSKANTSDLKAVATTGSYNDLTNKPTFKTINSISITGSGDITISGSGTGDVVTYGDSNIVEVIDD